jgi:hypothetical protein
MNDLFLHNRTIHYHKVKRATANGARFLLSSLILIVIIGASGSYYFYKKNNAIKTTPDLQAKKETEALSLAVGKLMELPKNEIPTVAVISNKEKLKDQAFFKAAEDGDRLLAYNTAMIAVLYRPRINKIINVAPISFNLP